jgi:hypothetical protein
MFALTLKLGVIIMESSVVKKYSAYLEDEDDFDIEGLETY